MGLREQVGTGLRRMNFSVLKGGALSAEGQDAEVWERGTVITRAGRARVTALVCPRDQA